MDSSMFETYRMPETKLRIKKVQDPDWRLT